jgi:hypothetical protein
MRSLSARYDHPICHQEHCLWAVQHCLQVLSALEVQRSVGTHVMTGAVVAEVDSLTPLVLA